MSAVLTTRARRFIRIGGRLMLDRAGALHVSVDAATLLGSTLDPETIRRRFGIARRIAEAQRNGPRRAALVAIVGRNGKRRATGWTVWEGR